MAIELVELSCPKCGAPLQFAPSHPIAVCPFCDARIAATTREGARRIHLEDVGQLVLPFLVTRETFEARFLNFLIEGEYTPDDVLTHAAVREHVGLYVTAWRFLGAWSMKWTCQAGFDHVETFVDTSRTFQRGKWREIPVQRTRTVTDWRPWNGESAGDYDILLLSSGRIPAAHMEFAADLTGISTSDLVPLRAQHLDGQVVREPPHEAADIVWEQRGKPALKAHREEVVRRSVAGADRVSGIDGVPDIRPGRTAEVLIPYWLVTYSYGDKTYHVVADGARDRLVGTKPVDRERKKRVDQLYSPVWTWAAIWSVVTILGLVLLVVPGLISLVGGGLHVWYLYNRASQEHRAIRSSSRAVREALRAKVASSGSGVAASLRGNT